MPYTVPWSPETLTRDEVDALAGPTVLEFGADWCPHCQAVQPALKAFLEQQPEIRHLKVEDGRGRPLGRSFAVKLWPNFVLLRDGRVLSQLARPEPSALDDALRQLA